jgi:catechol 2,3-dioxygenase-like lactoylglutathione lyase family enzyme
MLDHISFAVKNYEDSVYFYDTVLAILGYKREFTLDLPTMRAVGYGDGGIRPCLWISAAGREDEVIGRAQGVHIAFKATNVKAIRYWYEKCIELGGVDNGAPGPRHHYHPGYYGAFIIDPNGWRIEACLHNYQQ